MMFLIFSIFQLFFVNDVIGIQQDFHEKGIDGEANQPKDLFSSLNDDNLRTCMKTPKQGMA